MRECSANAAQGGEGPQVSANVFVREGRRIISMAKEIFGQGSFAVCEQGLRNIWRAPKTKEPTGSDSLTRGTLAEEGSKPAGKASISASRRTSSGCVAAQAWATEAPTSCPARFTVWLVQLLHEFADVFAHCPHIETIQGFVGLPEAAQVGRDDRIASVCDRWHDQAPLSPVLRKAVKQDKCRTVATDNVVDAQAATHSGDLVTKRAAEAESQDVERAVRSCS